MMGGDEEMREWVGYAGERRHRHKTGDLAGTLPICSSQSHKYVSPVFSKIGRLELKRMHEKTRKTDAGQLTTV
jgi:hypothetical protein